MSVTRTCLRGRHAIRCMTTDIANAKKTDQPLGITKQQICQKAKRGKVIPATNDLPS